MDVAAPLVDHRNPGASGAARVVLVFFLTLFPLAGCAGSAPAPVVSPPAESFIELKEKIARLRGLPFKRTVSFATQAVDDLSPETAESEEYGAQPAARISHAYQRLGLLPQSVDLAYSRAEYLRLQRLFFFDVRHESVVVTAEAAMLSRALFPLSARGADSFATAFALTQGLQAQHFRWPERLRTLPLEDRKLAFRAVGYGEAVLVALAAVDGNASPAKRGGQLAAASRLAAELEKTAVSLPNMLREQLVFLYREGTRFVQWAYAAKGWEGVNSLLTDPPLSTAQILHPEKYFIKRQDPLRIFPWGFLRQFKDSATMDQTLGEATIQTLLRSTHSAKDAAETASGWRGDYLSTASDAARPVTVWISAWSDASKAREFYRAYETVLARHHRLRFSTFSVRKDSSQAETADGRALVLELRGLAVLFLDGLASSRVSEVADAIWKDLEMEAEPGVSPFDTAKKWSQSSRRSR